MESYHRTLVSVETLQAHLEDPAWRVVDCRFSLADPAAGRERYAQGHVPGAVYADLEQDLSAAPGPGTGRHPLPGSEALAARLAEWGIGARTQVVAYDDAGGAFAARLWWLLRWLGHEAVAVLDGGVDAWVSGGGTLSRERPAPSAPASPAFQPQSGVALSAEEVRAGLSEGRILLLDAREAARFRGEVEPIDPVAGHVPGARNLPFAGNLAADGRFLAAEALRARFAPVLGGAASEAVVHMCGSGVTACHNQLAMEHAGLHGSRLYPGSWSEWIAEPGRPVARGEE